MTTTPPPVDPRSIITPDNFGVAPDLLGLPLAGPWRRASAMAIDGFAIALLTQAGGVFLGIIAAGALWRASSPRGAEGMIRRGARTTLRLSAALVIFVVIANSFDGLFNVFNNDDDDDDAEPARVVATTTPVDEDSSSNSVSLDLSFADLAAAPAFISLLSASDSATASRAADDVAEWLDSKNYTAAQEQQFVRGILDEVDNAEARAALRARFGVAADTATGAPDREAVLALQREIEELRESNEELRAEAERASERGGILAFFRSIADDLGLGFGWSAVYFTAFLAMWRGQTLGKRMMGVRVIRLDGRPMSWWYAFERFGGYAASLSTGLLGFLQILWDRNRQGLHDKAVETVVIRDTGTYSARPGETRRVGGVRPTP